MNIKSFRTYPIPTVLDSVNTASTNKTKFFTLSNRKFKVTRPLRYYASLDYTNGLFCRRCNLQAKFFRYYSKSSSKYGSQGLRLQFDQHDWNLQGTIDHIVFKSLGGTNQHSNLQFLCSKCNFERGGTGFDKEIKDISFIDILYAKAKIQWYINSIGKNDNINSLYKKQLYKEIGSDIHPIVFVRIYYEILGNLNNTLQC
jgi:hypothetical protein